MTELTAEQRVFWDSLWAADPPRLDDEQDVEQFVVGFDFACQLEGLGEPDPDAVKALARGYTSGGQEAPG